MTPQAAGTSTADLENQRDAAVQTLSQTLSVNTLVQPNGDMMVTTAGGTELPTHGPADPLSDQRSQRAAGFLLSRRRHPARSRWAGRT